jgi:hypothetical protein
MTQGIVNLDVCLSDYVLCVRAKFWLKNIPTILTLVLDQKTH